MKPIASSLKRKKHYDLPLQRGSGGQLVAWTVGVMTYLTVLTLVLVFALSDIQHYWQQGLTGRMTIEVPYDKNNPIADDIKQTLTDSLNKLPGIHAKFLTQDDISALVGPWLGTNAALADLPLPNLVDVTRDDDDNAASQDTIAQTAKQIIPSATLDTHQEWLADLMRLAKACRMILVGISLILAITSALTVAATAKTRLALHKDEVDLLHLIGATDSYIATQFQRQAFRLATEGAAAGLAVGLITLLIISIIKGQFGSSLLPGVTLSWLEWASLLLSPIMAGVIAMIASRFAVLRALKDMP